MKNILRAIDILEEEFGWTIERSDLHPDKFHVKRPDGEEEDLSAKELIRAANKMMQDAKQNNLNTTIIKDIEESHKFLYQY